jgi:hypothetical protein
MVDSLNPGAATTLALALATKDVVDTDQARRPAAA